MWLRCYIGENIDTKERHYEYVFVGKRNMRRYLPGSVSAASRTQLRRGTFAKIEGKRNGISKHEFCRNEVHFPFVSLPIIKKRIVEARTFRCSSRSSL